MKPLTPCSAHRPGLAALAVLTLAGCASVVSPDRDYLASAHTVRVLPGAAMDQVAVREVMSPDAPKVSPQADELGAQAQSQAQALAQQAWKQELAGFDTWTVVSSPMPPGVEPRELAKRLDARLDPASSNALKLQTGADAVLQFEITDYGRTPKAWRNGVIAFEVVSTLGIAAIAYARPATRAIAGAYLIQETIEESIEAYSGFWALDEVYRPVRVEASLTDLASGRRVWSDSETGLSDRRLARIWTTVTLEERRAQLAASLREAIHKLAQNLKGAALQAHADR